MMFNYNGGSNCVNKCVSDSSFICLLCADLLAYTQVTILQFLVLSLTMTNCISRRSDSRLGSVKKDGSIHGLLQNRYTRLDVSGSRWLTTGLILKIDVVSGCDEAGFSE